MFIKVTRSAAVSALASGLEVRLDACGVIVSIDARTLSKRACRRMLSRAYSDFCMPGDPVSFSVLLRQGQNYQMQYI